MFRYFLAILLIAHLSGCNGGASGSRIPSGSTGGQSSQGTRPSSGTQPVGKPVDEAAEKASLKSYLTAPSIDPEVKKLAEKGVSRYKDATTGLKTKRVGQPAKGGRSPNWIFDTFQVNEADLVDQLTQVDGPKTWSVKIINDLYQELSKSHPPDNTATKADFVMVEGLSVNYLHEAPLGDGSFLQLASQFNFLESTSSNIASVTSYRGDPTQGPQGSIEAAAAALHRTAAEKAYKLLNALIDVLPEHHKSYYENGYLELFKIKKDAELQALRDHIATNLDKLLILPQWVINEASGHGQMQVFSAAPSYQGGGGKPAPNSPAGQICTLLVAAQYEAIAKLAVMRSILTNKPVAVHFTLVGQGVFNNPPEVMQEAFTGVAEIVKGYPKVHVYVHGFSDHDQDLIRNDVGKIKDKGGSNLINLTIVDKDQFMAAPAL
jgi:hypothetical protein